jgi:hypothetical protein
MRGEFGPGIRLFLFHVKQVSAAAAQSLPSYSGGASNCWGALNQGAPGGDAAVP